MGGRTQKTLPDQEQGNFTDLESHIMVTKTQGVQQAYNAQILVDADEGVMVAATLSKKPWNFANLAYAVSRTQGASGPWCAWT